MDLCESVFADVQDYAREEPAALARKMTIVIRWPMASIPAQSMGSNMRALVLAKVAAIAAFRFVVRSGALAGLGSVSFVGLASVAYDRPIRGALLVLAFTTTSASHALDRILDPHDRVARSRDLAGAAAALFLAGLLVALRAGLFVASVLACAFPLSVVLYVVPLFPRRCPRRLKDVPFAKGFYVASMWSLLALLPCFIDRAVIATSATAMVAFTWGKVFVGTVAADLKDVRADRQTSTVTFATAWGPARTVAVFQGVNVLLVAFTVLFVLIGAFPKHLAVTELHSVVVAFALTASTTSETNASIGAGLIELSGALMLPVALAGRALLAR